MLAIFLIAIAVFTLAFIVWLIRLLMDGRRQRAKMHERRVEDEERKQLFAKPGGDWIKPIPTAGEMFDAVDKEARRRGRQLLKKDDDTKTRPVIPVAK
mgnify:CR=1 FL=1